MNVSYHSERDPGFLWLLPLCTAIKTRVGGIVRVALLVSPQPWLASKKGRGLLHADIFLLCRRCRDCTPKNLQARVLPRRGRAKMESEGPSASRKQTRYAVQSPPFLFLALSLCGLKTLYALKSVYLKKKKKKPNKDNATGDNIWAFCIGLRFL